jgi:hypothetical protein
MSSIFFFFEIKHVYIFKELLRLFTETLDCPCKLLHGSGTQQFISQLSNNRRYFRQIRQVILHIRDRNHHDSKSCAQQYSSRQKLAQQEIYSSCPQGLFLKINPNEPNKLQHLRNRARLVRFNSKRTKALHGCTSGPWQSCLPTLFALTKQ